MKLTDLWQPDAPPTVSFEFFPAHDGKAATKLERAINELANLEPDFVSVTFGAGGSSRESSFELADHLMTRKGLEVLAYFAGYGLAPEVTVQTLDGYRDLGVENVLVVRGDPPQDDASFQPDPNSLPHASDLLALVRDRYDFCLGGAGYPEGHKEAESQARDWEFVRLKVERGASFIIAQYFYDNRLFFAFRDGLRALGVEVPIIPGIMPIFNVKIMQNLARMCGATIPDEVRAGLADLPPGDKDAVVAFGTDLALRQCRELLEAGVPGIHFYTMDRSKSCREIVRRLRSERLL